MKTRFQGKSGKYLQKLPQKQRKQVSDKIEKMSLEPRPHDSRLLTGELSGHRRVDIGEYRIIYFVEGDTLFIAAIGKRNDDEVYRRLLRRLGG